VACGNNQEPRKAAELKITKMFIFIVSSKVPGFLSFLVCVSFSLILICPAEQKQSK
jgi:hypothetical protein